MKGVSMSDLILSRRQLLKVAAVTAFGSILPFKKASAIEEIGRKYWPLDQTMMPVSYKAKPSAGPSYKFEQGQYGGEFDILGLKDIRWNIVEDSLMPDNAIMAVDPASGHVTGIVIGDGHVLWNQEMQIVVPTEPYFEMSAFHKAARDSGMLYMDGQHLSMRVDTAKPVVLPDSQWKRTHKNAVFGEDLYPGDMVRVGSDGMVYKAKA